MPPLAYFGIESSGLSVAIDLLILFAAAVYVALVYWTWADARRRVEDPVMVSLATVVALVPFAGPLVYMILRPPEYLDDVRERELEMQAAEARIAQAGLYVCPYCDYRIERDFVRCPSCLRKLKERCTNCNRPLDQAWTICPYCEADVPGLTLGRSRRRTPPAPEIATEPEIPEFVAEPPGALRSEELDGTIATAAETTLAAGEAALPGAAERRSGERRASERRAAAAARAAARAGRTRPAP